MKRTLLIVLLLLGIDPAAYCQLHLNFRRVVNDGFAGEVDLEFFVLCNQAEIYDLDKKHIRVFENDKEITEFTCRPPLDPREHCAVSVALVLDAGNSMAGLGNETAIKVAETLVNAIDGMNDEMLVLWFDSTTTIAQPMTWDKYSLLSAIQSLPARGPSRMWDGIYRGIQELGANGANVCRSVIVMSTGSDSGSVHNSQAVIALAQKNRIKVFTICVGDSVNDSTFQELSLMTDGKYFVGADSNQIAKLYSDISTIIRPYCFNFFHIAYKSFCKDGLERNVDLNIHDFCNGETTQRRTYIAPLDSTLLPVIVSHRDTLFASPALFYQWHRNDSAIAGATDRFHQIAGLGSYTVTVTDTSGCVYTSLPFNVLSAASIPTASEYFEAYPNPFGSKLEITGSLATPGEVTIIVYDLLGKERLRTNEHVGTGAFRQTLDAASLPVGVYMLRVVTPNGGYVKRAVKKFGVQR